MHSLSKKVFFNGFTFEVEFVTADGKTIAVLTLNQADIQLEQLRLWLRYSRDYHLITVRQYEHAARQLGEVGRMLGAWIKQT
jgi:hypothetical protein